MGLVHHGLLVLRSRREAEVAAIHRVELALSLLIRRLVKFVREVARAKRISLAVRVRFGQDLIDFPGGQAMRNLRRAAWPNLLPLCRLDLD